MKFKQHINVPNSITAYRILAVPFIVFTLISANQNAFAILLIISLVSDILDGFLARILKQQTEFGARLDSIADDLTYILAISGMFVFKYADIQPHLLSFVVFIVLFVFSNVLALIKFGRFPSLHLYSWKIGGYLQGAFFLLLFAYDFILPLYYFVIFWGIIAFSEHIIIQLISKEMASNSKGLYWVLKQKNV